MKRIAWVVLGCLFLMTSAQAENIFVGLKYSSYELPRGCINKGSAFVGGDIDQVVFVRSCRKKLFITLDRLTHRDEKGIPHWEVIALENLPRLRTGESVSNEADGCSNPSGGATVAIAKWRANKEKTYAYDISYAIRWNLEASKFEVLDTKLVTCEFDDDRN
jgi:hypothetical protein